MKKFIILLLIPICTTAQLTKKEQKKVDKILKRSAINLRGFNDKIPISVESDSENVSKIVEEGLFIYGFDVISNELAYDRVRISNPLNQNNKDITIQVEKVIPTTYMIDLSGELFAGDSTLSFFAKIIDLSQDGKLVGSFRFKGNNAYAPNIYYVSLAFCTALKNKS
jgi:hypothetical protein